MTDEPAAAAPANSAFRVLAAIADLGEATAAAIAEKAGLGYSTVTPKLRAWEDARQAEKYYNDDKSQTLWRLTEAGRASTAAPARHTATPTEGGTAAAPAAAKPATRKREATVAEPEQHDGTPAAPALPPDTAADDETQATDASTTAADPPDAPPAAGESVPVDGDTADATKVPGTQTRRRRPKGALEASALSILQANPDTEYKVGAMKAAIDAADADTGYPRASEGATTNALDKLARENKAVRVEDRKAATFQLAPTTD